MPCIPNGVAVEIDCSKNQATVSWSASEGALSYKVSAQSPQGAMSLCETTDLMCTVTNLTCGQSYSVQVVAQDDICSSLPSPATSFQSGRTSGRTLMLFENHKSLTCSSWCALSVTAVLFFFPPFLVPCTPDIGSVVLDCFTNSAFLEWSYTDGALSYTATARSSSGHVSTCRSNRTNCELLDLQCGYTYNVVTAASNKNCTSLPSASLQVESGELLN